jgi:hypothetical protein
MASKHPPPRPIPTAHSTASFWRSSIKPIDNHRSTDSLPSNADIVIIGAGYAGAAIAHHLIEESERHNRPLPSVVVLEAREACSGATGRNGKLWRLCTGVFYANRCNTETPFKAATSSQIHIREQLAS